MSSRTTSRIVRAAAWMLLAAANAGCYHQYLQVTGSDQLPERQEKTVYSYAWGLVHSRDSVAVCGATGALDQVEVKSTFGMTLLSLVTLGIVVPRRMIWYCSTPRECVDDIGLLHPATAACRVASSTANGSPRRGAARP